MSGDPAAAQIENDLASPVFRAGVAQGRWRLISRAFPILFAEVKATEPDGTQAYYNFRIDVSGYPGKAPHVRIWNLSTDQPLRQDLRPKGCHRVSTTFQNWQHDTVYRPWERMAAEHNNFRLTFPQLAWHVGRTLTFVLEDISGILALNGRADRVRLAASACL